TSFFRSFPASTTVLGIVWFDQGFPRYEGAREVQRNPRRVEKTDNERFQEAAQRSNSAEAEWCPLCLDTTPKENKLYLSTSIEQGGGEAGHTGHRVRSASNTTKNFDSERTGPGRARATIG
ncbi:unnamed protein product, partial [Ectocarpus sp. 8 AP-2014]